MIPGTFPPTAPSFSVVNSENSPLKTIHNREELLEELKLKEVIDLSGRVIGNKPLEPLPDICIKRINELLNRSQPIQSRDKTFKEHIVLSDLLVKLDDDFEIVGSKALSLLGAEYLESLLIPYDLNLSQELKDELNHEIPKGRDLDLRSAVIGNYALAQARLCDALKALFDNNAYDTYFLSQNAFQRASSLKEEPIFLATIGDGGDEDVDLIFYNKLVKENICSIDSLKIKVKKLIAECSFTHPLQVYVDYLTGIARLEKSELLNKLGVCRLVSYSIKGYSFEDPTVIKRELTRLKESCQDKEAFAASIASHLKYTADSHHDEKETAFVLMALSAATALENEEDLKLFWKEVSRLSLGLFDLPLSILSTDSTYSFIRMDPPNFEGLLSICKDPEPLYSFIKLLEIKEVRSINLTVLNLLLPQEELFSLFNLFCKHLTPLQKEQFEARICHTFYQTSGPNSCRRNQFSIAMAKTLVLNPIEFTDFYQLLAEDVLKEATKKGAAARSRVIELLDLAVSYPESLVSHDAFMAVFMMAISLKGGLPKRSYPLDFTKISSPHERLRTAYQCDVQKVEFSFQNFNSTIQELEPTLERDKWVRILVSRIKNVSPDGVLDWLKQCINKNVTKEFALWFPILSSVCLSCLKEHPLTLFFIDYLLNTSITSHEICSLIKSLEIPVENLEQVLKRLKKRGDKAAIAFIWANIRSIRDENFLVSLFTPPRPQLLSLLPTATQFKNPQTKEKLLLSCLQLESNAKDLETYFSYLVELKKSLPPCRLWVVWLLKFKQFDKFVLALEEMKLLEPDKEMLSLWVENYLNLNKFELLDFLQSYRSDFLNMFSHPLLEPEKQIDLLLFSDLPLQALSVVKVNPDKIPQEVQLKIVSRLAEGSAEQCLEAKKFLLLPSIKKTVPVAIWQRLFCECALILLEKGVPGLSPNELLELVEEHSSDLAHIDVKHQGYEEKLITQFYQLISQACEQNCQVEKLYSTLYAINSVLLLKYNSSRQGEKSKIKAHLLESKDAIKFTILMASSTTQCSNALRERLINFAYLECRALQDCKPSNIDLQLYIRDHLYTLFFMIGDEHPQYGSRFLEDTYVYLNSFPPEATATWNQHQKDLCELFILYLNKDIFALAPVMAFTCNYFINTNLYQFRGEHPINGSLLQTTLDQKLSHFLISERIHLDIVKTVIRRYISFNSAAACFRASVLLGNIQKNFEHNPSAIETIWIELLEASNPFLTHAIGETYLYQLILICLFKNDLPFNSENTKAHPSMVRVAAAFFKMLVLHQSLERDDPIRACILQLASKITITKVFSNQPLVYFELIKQLIVNGHLWFNLPLSFRPFDPILNMIMAPIFHEEPDLEVIKKRDELLYSWIEELQRIMDEGKDEDKKKAEAYCQNISRLLAHTSQETNDLPELVFIDNLTDDISDAIVNIIVNTTGRN